MGVGEGDALAGLGAGSGWNDEPRRCFSGDLRFSSNNERSSLS